MEWYIEQIYIGNCLRYIYEMRRVIWGEAEISALWSYKFSKRLLPYLIMYVYKVKKLWGMCGFVNGSIGVFFQCYGIHFVFYILLVILHPCYLNIAKIKFEIKEIDLSIFIKDVRRDWDNTAWYNITLALFVKKFDMIQFVFNFW